MTISAYNMEMDPKSYLSYLEDIKLSADKSATTLKITPELAHNLSKEIFANATRLLDDAVLLHKENKSPSAAALAILCIEEMGKLELVLKLLSCPDGEVSKLWREFRNHKSKNHQWLYPHLQAANATYEVVERFKDPKSNAAIFLDNLKMAAFYSEITENGSIRTPNMLTQEFITDTIRSATAVVFGYPGVQHLEYFKVWQQYFKGNENTSLFEFYEILYKKKIIAEEQYTKIKKNLATTFTKKTTD